TCDPEPWTVDVRDASADPATAEAVVAELRQDGAVVGTVSVADGPAPETAVEFPAGREDEAGVLAEALGLAAAERETGAVREADVPQLTVVLGADAGELHAFLGGLTGLPVRPCEVPAED
ncbi:LytR C-terminal domain-containing protein, partial [Modestobacter roseus]